MEESESSVPGMNIAPVVYLTFVVEGDQILFVLKTCIADQSQSGATTRGSGVHVVVHSLTLLDLKQGYRKDS